MPEYIRALVVILSLAFVVFAIAKAPATQLISFQDYSRRRNLWFGVTIAAFLTQNFWIYLLISTSLIFISSKTEKKPVALFFILLFVVPQGFVDVPGFGIVNYIFTLSHQRMITLIIFLPLSFQLFGKKDSVAFGKLLPDKLISAYMLLIVALYLRETTLTDVLRQAFYQYIDIFLPYYVISRHLKKIEDFKHAILAFILASMVLAIVGFFELVKHWLLYKSLFNALDIQQVMTSYLGRSSYLRAIASAGHPIALGYVMAVAIGLYFFLQHYIKSNLYNRLGLLLILAGLYASLSRGPWVGALVVVLALALTGRNSIQRLGKLAIVGVITLLVLSILPFGEKIINLIPFVGETETGNISYRQKLIVNSTHVIKRNPFFGSVNYMHAPEMQELKQGQGIIDIVNSYVGIALNSGLVGLFLFLGFFVSIILKIFSQIRKIPDKVSPEHLLGQSLIASLLGILLIIFTVSGISVIPIVYWSIAGLGVAFIQMKKNNEEISAQ